MASPPSRSDEKRGRVLRVAVTGAAGFVGRHVIDELLRRGHQVDGTLGCRSDLSGVPVRTAKLDLLDTAPARQWLLTVRPDALIHLAWSTTPGEYRETSENDRWQQASSRLFEAALEAGCTRIVGVGSCAEYVWNNEVCSEAHTRILPRTAYGHAKAATCAALDKAATGAGVSWAWARLFHLFGPGEPEAKLVASVIRALSRGDVAPCTSGRQERDYLFVRDTASALVSLLEADVVGPVNVASGRALPIRTLVETIISRFGSGRAEFGAIPTDPAEPQRLVADVRRLRDEVGWTPRTDLARAIDETITHARQRG